jgi:hypothetical protein
MKQKTSRIVDDGFDVLIWPADQRFWGDDIGAVIWEEI